MEEAASGEENEFLFTKIVGAKFKPTDSILVDHYLAGKVCGRTEGPIFQLIKEEKLYKYEPQQFSSLGPYDFGTGKSYFFTGLKTIKTENGRNVDRSVAGGVGCWKKTGKVIDVLDEYENIIGIKTSLAYYTNDGKTNWLMIEFRLGDKKYEMLEKEYKMVEERNKRLALCVVYYLNGKRPPRNYGRDSPSRKSITPPDAEIQHLSVYDYPISPNENLGDGSWSCDITNPDSHQNMQFSGMGTNIPNFVPVSSLSMAHNSCLNFWNDPRESWLANGSLTASPWNPDKQDNESSLSAVHFSTMLMEYSQDDQATAWNLGKKSWSSNGNPGNESWPYNITIPDSHPNMPISGIGNNSQSGAEESIINSTNFEPVSSLSTPQNSSLNFWNDPRENWLANGSLTASFWNPDKQDNESSLSAVHFNNTLMRYSQDDQATASIAQIPNCQNDPVMGNSHGENLNHNILMPSHENLNHHLQQSLAFQMPNFYF